MIAMFATLAVVLAGLIAGATALYPARIRARSDLPPLARGLRIKVPDGWGER